MSDRDIAEWLLCTLRMFGVGEADAYKITGLFLEAINNENLPG